MAAATKDKSGGWIMRALFALMVLTLAYLIVRILITLTNPESIWASPQLVTETLQANSAQVTQIFNFNTDPFNRTAPATAEVAVQRQD